MRARCCCIARSRIGLAGALHGALASGPWVLDRANTLVDLAVGIALGAKNLRQAELAGFFLPALFSVQQQSAAAPLLEDCGGELFKGAADLSARPVVVDLNCQGDLRMTKDRHRDGRVYPESGQQGRTGVPDIVKPDHPGPGR
jgi:hypothetical protein